MSDELGLEPILVMNNNKYLVINLKIKIMIRTCVNDKDGKRLTTNTIFLKHALEIAT